MYVKQGDLFWEMSNDLVKEIMDISAKMSPVENEIIFHKGDPADNFYILIKGRVMLSLGEEGPSVYIARHPGEIIGWSSLIGRDSYSASAKSLEPGILTRINSATFLKIINKDPVSEANIFRKLVEMLGKRLMGIYPSIT